LHQVSSWLNLWREILLGVQARSTRADPLTSCRKYIWRKSAHPTRAAFPALPACTGFSRDGFSIARWQGLIGAWLLVATYSSNCHQRGLKVHASESRAAIAGRREIDDSMRPVNLWSFSLVTMRCAHWLIGYPQILVGTLQTTQT
jgi:hypothetical protein